MHPCTHISVNIILLFRVCLRHLILFLVFIFLGILVEGLHYTPDFLHLWVLAMVAHFHTHVTSMTSYLRDSQRYSMCFECHPSSEKPMLLLDVI